MLVPERASVVLTCRGAPTQEEKAIYCRPDGSCFLHEFPGLVEYSIYLMRSLMFKHKHSAMIAQSWKELFLGKS
jgi:hypothetical protein